MLTQEPAELHTRMPGYLPLGVQDGIERFRVEGTIAVRSMLRELMSSQVNVVIYNHQDDAHHLVTHVERIEPLDFCLRFVNDHRGNLEHVLQSSPLTLVGITGSVKIQLPVDSLTKRNESAGIVLEAPIPSHGWRIQRRDAFRVTPPEEDNALVMVRQIGPDNVPHDTAARLHDISAGGLCFYWPESLPQPELGKTLQHCRVERSRAAPLPCDLKVVRIAPSEESGQQLVSCRFQLLPDSVSRQIQIYVMDVERRIRNARVEA